LSYVWPGMYEVQEYVTEEGVSPFAKWLGGLKDRRAGMRLLARLDRASLGNLGDWKVLPDTGGLAELRDRYGSGYRVYFSFVSPQNILLLIGSTKRGAGKSYKEGRNVSEGLQTEG
jgi:putative addiction module killer protein